MAKNTFMIIDPELGNVDLFNEHPVKIEDFKKNLLQKGWVTINGAHVLIGEDGEPAETAYRGSDSGKIDINRTGEHGSVDGKGIYLSTSQEVASRYGKVRTHAIDKSSLIFDDKKLSPKQVTSLQKVVGKDYLNWNKVPNGKWLFERLNLTHKNPEKILQIAGINGIRFTPIVKGGANYKNYLLFNKKPIIDTVGKTVEKGWVTVNGQHRFYDDSGTGGNAHRGGAGTAVADAPTQIAYAPASNLTPDERAVEERFGRQLTDNPDQAIQEYEGRFDHELNTDNVRELSPDYSASKDSRSQYARAVHEPASALTKEMYARDLEMPTPEGKQKMVLFTAGGTGSGKTSALRDIPEMQNLKSSAKLTYDTNMNTFSSAKSKIDQALATGHNVAIAYVNRDPVESLMLGAVPRAERTGRTVPLAEHVKTHVGSISTVKALASHYANNPHVKISVIDNTRGRGGAVVSSLDSLNKINYNSTELTSQLNGALDRAYAEGQVSTSVYNGFKGL